MTTDNRLRKWMDDSGLAASLKTIAIVVIVAWTWGTLGTVLIISLWNPLTDVLGIGDWPRNAQLAGQVVLLGLWTTIAGVPLVKREQRQYAQGLRVSHPDRFSVKDSGDSGTYR